MSNSSFDSLSIGCFTAIFFVFILISIPLFFAWKITGGGGVQNIAETHAKQWDNVEKVVCSGSDRNGDTKCIAYTRDSQYHYSCSGFWGECYNSHSESR